MEKFFIDQDNTALLIVDIQERLASVMKMKDAVVNNCRHLIELAKLLRIPVLVTEQYPKGLGHTVDEIKKALPAYRPIEKLTFSCCDEAIFLNEIKGLNKKNLILTGMETHICVLQTCIALLREGFCVHLVRDAVCSRVKENWEIACQLMRDAGAVITCTETVLFQILRTAGTKEFRAISKRIK